MTFVNEAYAVLKLLKAQQVHLVLAESCTGGLVAARLAEVPGASQWFCGSAVTSREQTKEAWLGVSSDALARWSGVSEPVSVELVVGVLEKTPEASLAASVTGHLGPDAPVDLDGVIFLATTWRGKSDCVTVRHQLTERERLPRQQEAAGLVLQQLVKVLSEGELRVC